MKAWAIDTIDGIFGIIAVLGFLVVYLVLCAICHPVISGWWARQCFKEGDPDWKKFLKFFLQGLVFGSSVILVAFAPWPGKIILLLPLVVYIAVGNDLFDAIDEKQQYGKIEH